MATARQNAANLLNSKKSTGPKTDEGKAVSRANALKHGLAGDGVVTRVDDAKAVAGRLESWSGNYDLVTDEDAWLFEQVVVNSVKVDRCQRDEFAARDYHATRASVSWDEDRRLEAEELGATLAKRPAVVALRLRQTTQGADWLIGRWRALGVAAEAGVAWTEAQRSKALDLLGVSHDLRDPSGGLGPWAEPGGEAGLVGREIDRLERLKAEALDDLDAVEQSAAEAGFPVRPPKVLALLRRYEAACMRRLQWARARLKGSGRATGRPKAAPAPRPAPAPAPAMAPAAPGERVGTPAPPPPSAPARVGVSAFRLRDAMAVEPLNRRDRKRLASGR